MVSFVHPGKNSLVSFGSGVFCPTFDINFPTKNSKSLDLGSRIGQVGMTSLQVNCSLAEVNASVFIAVF